MDIGDILRSAKIDKALHDPGTPRLVINLNKVADENVVPGLEVEPRELEDGVDVKIRVLEGTVIEKPVHLCFGVTQEQAVQRIIIEVEMLKGSRMDVLAHCVFPAAVDIKHIMYGKIKVGEEASYSYTEKHIHSPEGGLKVLPRAVVELEKRARMRSEFDIVKGRAGIVDISYETRCGEESVMEMTAKVKGSGDDEIRINESGILAGRGARGVLTSKVVVRDRARAEVYNKLTATAAGARGHVDCKEIIQDEAVAVAVPVVEVRHPKAHVTHEAAIGSVDGKQLETLMARGLSEDDAVELIIEGLLA